MASQLPMLGLLEDNCVGQWCSYKPSSTWKCEYLWIIRNFSTKSSNLTSSYFPGSSIKYRWYLKLHMNNIDKENNDGCYSLYIHVETPKTASVLMKYTFSLLNAEGEKTNIASCEDFKKCNHGTSYGFGTFITQENLVTKKDDLLTCDRLKIYCEVHFIIESKEVCEENSRAEFKIPRSIILDNLNDIFKHKKYHDVEFIVGPSGEKFQAHKVILTARSSVFLAMFGNDMKESQDNQVTVADFSPEVFNEMLRFIYTDEVKDLDRLAKDLLSIANYYNLRRLKMMCEKSIYKNLTIDTIAETLILADLFSAHTLKARVISFANKYAKEFTQTEGFQSMKETHLKLASEVLEKFVDDPAMYPVITEINHLLLNVKLSDVTLVVGDDEIPAHKVILAGQSPVFMDTFETSATPDRIIITDIKSSVMKEVLAYLYTGDFVKNNDTDVLLKVLAVAETYGIKKLKTLCGRKLEKNLSLDTAISILIEDDDYDVTDLLRKTLDFVQEKKQSIMSLDNFKKLCSKKPELLFKILHLDT